MSQHPATIDVELSRRLIEETEPRWLQYFRNAQLALWRCAPFMPELDGFVYVEGYLGRADKDCDNRDAWHVHHAWLEGPDGRIVELSKELIDAPYIFKYCAIARYSRDEIGQDIWTRGDAMPWCRSRESLQ